MGSVGGVWPFKGELLWTVSVMLWVVDKFPRWKSKPNMTQNHMDQHDVTKHTHTHIMCHWPHQHEFSFIDVGFASHYNLNLFFFYSFKHVFVNLSVIKHILLSKNMHSVTFECQFICWKGKKKNICMLHSGSLLNCFLWYMLSSDLSHNCCICTFPIWVPQWKKKTKWPQILFVVCCPSGQKWMKRRCLHFVLPSEVGFNILLLVAFTANNVVSDLLLRKYPQTIFIYSTNDFVAVLSLFFTMIFNFRYIFYFFYWDSRCLNFLTWANVFNFQQFIHNYC